MNSKIDWRYPEPDKGISGAFDRFIGPGATLAEIALELGFALAAGIAVVLYAFFSNLGWDIIQYAVAAILAFDIAGGVVTNATSSAKRWYHRDGQGNLQHMSFVVVHLHPFIVAWLFRGMDWAYGFVIYGYLLLSAAIILFAPQYLRRPLSMALLCVAIAIGLYVFSPTPGLEWFIPLFFLKLLVSHLVKEEPYRP